MNNNNGRIGGQSANASQMNFLELVASRYSVRSFSPEPVTEQDIETILEATRLAPTAKNLQPVHIRVLRSPEALAKADRVTKCRYGAPVVLLFSYDEAEDWKNPLEDGIHSGEQDAAIVATHAMLAATSLGLGSCWVGLFSPASAAETFDLPDTERAVAMLPLGHPTPEVRPAAWHSQRKPISETVVFL